MLELQRSAGNRATARLLRAPVVAGERGVGAAGGYEPGERDASQDSTGRVDTTAGGTLLFDFPVNHKLIKKEHQAELLDLINRNQWDSVRSLFPIKEIIGFTDAVNRQGGNSELREDRAGAVQTWLEVNGALLQNTGEAKAAPPDRFIATNETREGRARNRSVLIRTDAFLPPEPILGPLKLRLQVKVIVEPRLDVRTMIRNAKRAFAPHHITIDALSTERVPPEQGHDFTVVSTGSCKLSDPVSPELHDLHTKLRGDVSRDTVVIFVVGSVLRTDADDRGCARHPPDQPGAVIGHDSGPWTLAHELGHVLGLKHAGAVEKNRLMHAPTTDEPDEVPTLVPEEIDRIHHSPFVRPN